MTVSSWADLKGNASAGPEPVPGGTYNVVVEACDASTPTKQGKVMFKTRLRVEGGPYDGKPIFMNQTVSPESPAALAIFFRYFEAFGIDFNAFPGSPEDTKDAIAAALVGRRASVSVIVKTDDYGTKNEVKGVTAIAGATAAAPAAPVPPPVAPPVAPPAPATALTTTPTAPAAAPPAAPAPPF